MSKGKVSSEQSADTQEFDAVRLIEGVDERTEFELVGNRRIQVKLEFEHPIELRVGRDEQTPICYLVRNPWHLGRGGYAVVQPEVVRSHPGRGWIEFGGVGKRQLGKVGRLVSPELELGPDVSRRHCLIATTKLDECGEIVEIENYGRNGLRVLVHPDDLTGTIHEFDPEGTWEEAHENDPELDCDLRP
jgi:hypothetical protein